MTGVPPGCGLQLLPHEHVTDENLAYLCLGSETSEVEEPAI